MTRCFVFLKYCSFFLVLLLNSQLSFAEGLLDGYELKLGLAVRNLDLEVTSVTDKDPSGIMTEGQYDAPVVSLASPHRYFKDSSFGYYFEYGLYTFEMNYQVTAGGSDEEDLGTAVRGNALHFTPVAFYNVGNKLTNKNRHSFIIGLGIGIGYLDASGDIKFTETTSEFFDVDIQKFDIAVVALLEYHYGPWFIRYQNSGPSIREGDFDYDLVDEAFTIGYSFAL